MSIALDALRWITDTLLSKRKEKAARKTVKWKQVADYLDSLAKIIDSTVEDLKAARIPYGHYSQLCALANTFEKVLWQVYDIKNPGDHTTVRKFRDALYNSVHLVVGGDDIVLEVGSVNTELGRAVLTDLQAAAGQFRALAMTLRATA